MIMLAHYLACLLTAILMTPTAAGAQDYSSRPLRMIVGFTPGGTTDFMARLIATRMTEILGQPVVVENKPGASGAIAAEYVAKSQGDGATLFFSTVGALAINPALRSNLPYDPLKDFLPVGLAAFNSTILVVNTESHVNSARDLVELAKQRAVAVGVTGLGSISHLALELFASSAAVKFQAVPYRGASQAVTDLLGGQLDGLFADVPTIVAHVRAGRLRALAATSSERSEAFPEVPTLGEQGFPDTVANQWAGLLAPAHTPLSAVMRLNLVLNTALRDSDLRERLRAAGVTPSPGSPEEFAHYLREEITRWGRLIREKNIKGE